MNEGTQTDAYLEVDDEVSFGPNAFLANRDEVEKSEFILNWNVIEDEQENHEVKNEIAAGDREEMEALATVFMSRGQSELDIKRVGTCDGTDSTSLLRWLRTLDTTQRPIEIARATAIGPLATFLNKNKGKIWRPLRSAIASHFISASIQQVQRDALSKIEQRAGESLVSFNYEFEYLISEAYSKLPDDQEDLIRMYLGALNDRKLALSVLNENPTTLEKAMRLAFKKNQSHGYLKSRKTDAMTDQLEPVQHQLKILTKALTDLAKSQEVTSGRVAQLQSNPPKPVVKKEPYRTMVCFRCGNPGHFARECRYSFQLAGNEMPLSHCPPTPANSNGSFTPAVVNREKCSRCRSKNHKLADCHAGPPSKPCFCGSLHWVYDCPHRRPNAQNENQQGN